MPKPHSPRSSIFALFACLGVTLLLSAPPQNSAAQSQPLTPAQAAYGDLLARPAPPPAGVNLPLRPENPERSAPHQPGNDIPEKLEYTGLVFSSSLSLGESYDEEIYYLPGFLTYHNHTPTRLTNTPGAAFEPRLNSTSTRVVYTAVTENASGDTVANIHAINTDGTGEQALTAAASGANRMPAFSPDGTKIVFVSDRDGPGDIYVMDSAGQNVTRLTTAKGLAVSPSYSPDGTKIAWVRIFAEYAGDLMVMNADGSDPHAVLTNIPLLDRPVWSPSGSRLAFTFDADGNGWTETGVVAADGSGEILHLTGYLGEDQQLGSWVNTDNDIIVSESYYQWDELTEKWYFTGAGVWLHRLAEQRAEWVTIGATGSVEFNPYAQSRDDTPPVSFLYPAPAWSQEGSVLVRYHAADNVAGLHSFTLYWSTDGVTFGYPNLNTYWNSNDWPSKGSAWVASATETYAGQKLYFTSQAKDHAGNLEPAKTAAETFTRVYKWMASLTISDLRGYPVNAAQVTVDPAPMDPPVTGPDGKTNVYLSDWGSRAITYVKPGYVSPPNPALAGPDSTEAHPHRVLDSVMTGPDEQVTNGAFDDPQDALAGWQQSGDLPTAAAAGRLTGMAARTGGACKVPFCLNDGASVLPIKDLEFDSQGRLHVIYADSWYGIMHPDGSIDSWGKLPFTADDSTPIQFGPGDNPFFLKDWKLYLWTGSAWTVEDLPAMDHPYYGLRPVMDSGGRLHLLFSERDYGGSYYHFNYLVRSADGQWTVRAYLIDYLTSYDAPFYDVTADGTLHVVSGLCPAKYVQVKPDLTVTPASTFTMPNCYASHVALRAAPNGSLYLVSGGSSWPSAHWLAKVLPPGGSWTDLGPEEATGSVRTVRVSADSSLFVSSYVTNANLSISVVKAGGQSFYTGEMPAEVKTAARFAAAAGNQVHLTYLNSTNGATHAYRIGSVGSSAGASELTQHIDIPAGMNTPTLSFFVKVETPDSTPASRLKVLFTPDGADPVVVFDRQAANAPWSHLWADLTPYQGHSGTLVFRLEQQGGDSPVFASFDEVSVSSWSTPVVARFGPDCLPFPLSADAWVDLYGENFDPSAEVFIGGVKAQSEWVSADHLRVLVPAGAPAGPVPVRVANPSGGDSVRSLWVGSFIYLPALTR